MKKNELITAAAKEASQSLSAFTAVEAAAKRITDAVKTEDVTGSFAEFAFEGARVRGVVKAGSVVIKIDQ